DRCREGWEECAGRAWAPADFRGGVSCPGREGPEDWAVPGCPEGAALPTAAVPLTEVPAGPVERVPCDPPVPASARAAASAAWGRGCPADPACRGQAIAARRTAASSALQTRTTSPTRPRSLSGRGSQGTPKTRHP